jgi:hypothetical protein
MFLLIRWLRSGRGGPLARVGAALLLVALIALLVARVATSGWSGMGILPAVAIIAIVAWRMTTVARRRRAWPKSDAEPDARGTPARAKSPDAAAARTTGTSLTSDRPTSSSP